MLQFILVALLVVIAGLLALILFDLEQLVPYLGRTLDHLSLRRGQDAAELRDLVAVAVDLLRRAEARANETPEQTRRRIDSQKRSVVG